MFGNPEQERALLESTYEDICTIKRFQDVATGNLTEKQEMVVAEGVICAYSQRQLVATNQTDVQNDINYNPKLFLPPDVDVKAGDMIDVYRFGRTQQNAFVYECESAGEAMRYATHKEIILKRRERA